MKLLKLSVRNFKGLRNFTLEPNGHSVNIYGANEAGKTTIADALAFLLFDKDTAGKTPDAFGIKTRENGKPLSGMEHEVEGIFSNGLHLRKVYKEKWTKKRGEAVSNLTGHTTDYYVDGVEVKKKEYDEAVFSVMSAEQYRILTNPAYFPETMHWQDRRRILTDMAGEISTEDVIRLNPDILERYPQIVEKRGEDNQREYLKQRRRDLNRDLDNIPTRIDEASRQIVAVEGLDEARKQVAGLEEKRETISAKISEVKSGGAIADLKVRLTELDSEQHKLQLTHEEKKAEAVKDIRAKLSELQNTEIQLESDVREIRREYERAQNEKDIKDREIRQIEDDIERETLRQPDEKPVLEGKDCPVCERLMPAEKTQEQVDAEYDEYFYSFNSKKAENLKKLKNQLESAKNQVLEISERMKEITERGVKAKGKLNQISEHISKVETQLKEKQQNFAPVYETAEYKAIEHKKTDIQARINDSAKEKQGQLDTLSNHIAELDNKIRQAKQVIHQHDTNQKVQARIDELNAERKKNAEELEAVESDLYIIEQFVRARSGLITERVNTHFDKVQWRLFKEQINGGLEEVCDAVYKGIPYTEGLNTAGRVQAGLDITQTLSRHYGKSAPVIIDNRESITDIPESDMQIISLIVSPEHKQLLVEVEKQHEILV